MPYSEELAERVRGTLDGADVEAEERRMFGGLAFMVGGHMAVGVLGDDLVVRVGADAQQDALAEPHTREMDFTGRTIRSMVYVEPEGLLGDALAAWVDRGLELTAALPPR